MNLSGGPNVDQKRVAVFDFDNTMVLGDLAFAAQRLQVENHRFGFDPAIPSAAFPAEIAALFAEWGAAGTPAEKEASQSRIRAAVLGRYDRVRETEGPEAAMGYLASLLEGFTPDEARQLGREALQQETAQPVCTRAVPNPSGPPVAYPSGMRIRPAMAAMVKRLQDADFDVWVVSASPEPLVQGAAETYGIPATNVIGLRTVEEGDRLTAQVVAPLPWRQGKADAIQDRVGVRPALAFGDSWSDYEMLTSADRAVLMDRGTSDLRTAALNAGVALQPRFSGEPDPDAPCVP